jgi:hypothetical protein
LRSVSAIAAAVGFAAVARAAGPCTSCHRDQAAVQTATDMGRALLLPEANTVLKEHPKLTLRRGDYTYTIETRDSQSTYTVTDGKDAISIPIRWAFGDRSQTWVLEQDGRLYESLVSYYFPIKALDVTIGDAAIQPRTLREAFGRELSDFEAKSCFDCHATGAVTAGRLNLTGLIPGVQCDRCHTGADVHARAISQGKAAPPPQRLGAMSPEEISNFCGQCHRTWERVTRDRLRGPINVRFQPYRLANSKCYDGGDRRMSCTTCHDPHQHLVRNTASYDAKCVACHTGAPTKSCPVAKSGCAGCHMPKVELPGAHMIFSDHQIRVVRSGDPYPN